MIGVTASKRVTSVPQPSMRMLHGTYPPTPTLQKVNVKPRPADTRDYAKTPPLDGNTGTTSMT